MHAFHTRSVESLSAIPRRPHVVLLSEPRDFEACLERLTSSPSFVHSLCTDAYLAAFAIAAQCRLVSFDADFQTFDGLNFLHLTLA